jgi:hypothetical protein
MNRLISRNVCYHSIQNFLSSCTLSKNLKIKIYRTRILVGLYGYRIGPATVIEEHRWKIFEKKTVSNKKEENYLMSNFIICIALKSFNEGGWDR